MEILDLKHCTDKITINAVKTALNNRPIQSIYKIELPDNAIIDNGVFESFTSIQEITNMNSLKSVPDYAFTNCGKLKISDLQNYHHIGKYAFANTTLNGIVKLNTETELFEGCFKDCKHMTECWYSEYLHDIPDYCFSGCSSLWKIDVSKAVSIGDHAFENCDNLSELACRSLTRKYVIDHGYFSAPYGTVFTCFDGQLVSNGDIKKTDYLTDVFDRVYGIHFLPYTDRMPSFIKQLRDTGILVSNAFEFYYTTPNKYYDYLFYDDKNHIDVPAVNVLNLNYSVNSYNLLKKCYELGYERVMFIEDDVCFLKDDNLVKTYFKNIPADYDLVMLEYLVHSPEHDFTKSYKDLLTRNRKINEYFTEFVDEIVYDTGCFCVSRKMLKHMIGNIKKRLLPFDGYTYSHKADDDFGIRRCISNIPVAIQRNAIYDKQDIYEQFDKYPYVDKKDYRV